MSEYNNSFCGHLRMHQFNPLICDALLTSAPAIGHFMLSSTLAHATAQFRLGQYSQHSSLGLNFVDLPVSAVLTSNCL